MKTVEQKRHYSLALAYYEAGKSGEPMPNLQFSDSFGAKNAYEAGKRHASTEYRIWLEQHKALKAPKGCIY